MSIQTDPVMVTHIHDHGHMEEHEHSGLDPHEHIYDHEHEHEHQAGTNEHEGHSHLELDGPVFPHASQHVGPDDETKPPASMPPANPAPDSGRSMDSGIWVDEA